MFFRAERDGLTVIVRATPKASRTVIQGVMNTSDGLALKVMVTAPPDKGKANVAIAALLAKTFRVSKGSVSLIAGHANRRKILHIKGDPTTLSPIAQQWMNA